MTTGINSYMLQGSKMKLEEIAKHVEHYGGEFLYALGASCPNTTPEINPFEKRSAFTIELCTTPPISIEIKTVINDIECKASVDLGRGKNLDDISASSYAIYAYKELEWDILSKLGETLSKECLSKSCLMYEAKAHLENSPMFLSEFFKEGRGHRYLAAKQGLENILKDTPWQLVRRNAQM